MSESGEKSGELVNAALDSDSELSAIRLVLSALVPLKQEARTRVLDYALRRLGMAQSVQQPSGGPVTADLAVKNAMESSDSLSVSPSLPADIRSLAKQKTPRSANEMAALVAYYVSEVATEPYRRPTISVDDVKTYFKQAQFRLPQSPKQTLINAKNAGYLESVGQGQYRLNPVGYNLVVHSLPLGDSGALESKPRRPKKLMHKK